MREASAARTLVFLALSALHARLAGASLRAGRSIGRPRVVSFLLHVNSGRPRAQIETRPTSAILATVMDQDTDRDSPGPSSTDHHGPVSKSCAVSRLPRPGLNE